MSVKQLAKQLPLYGQQAISTALNALSVAGHLRRVRCSITNASGETRWAFRTFWSRTARDNEWWNTYLATESPSPGTPAPARRILMECTDCGRPGQPEALPDGLCRSCRTAHHPDTPPAEAADVRARMTNLRDLLKSA